MSNNTPYAHDHLFLGSAHDENARRTLWVVVLTVVMMVGEITAGYITGSMALLADGFHMATHAGALGIAAAAYGYAKRHASSQRYSFGTGKVGDLGGFASALILGMVSLGIGAESVMRLLQPTEVQFGTATLIAIAGLIVNIVSALLLGHGHDHDHDHHHGHGHAHHANDNNLKSAYAHVIADALTSVLAIAALLAGRYLGWVWLDPVMGIVGAIVIARWAWTLMGAPQVYCWIRQTHILPRKSASWSKSRGTPPSRTCTSGGLDRKPMRPSSASSVKPLRTPTAFVSVSNRFTKSAILRSSFDRSDSGPALH